MSEEWHIAIDHYAEKRWCFKIAIDQFAEKIFHGFYCNMLNGNYMVQFIDLPTYSMCYLNQPM